MLLPFAFKGNQVRVIILSGEPWFVAINVALILEYADPSKMLNLVDSEDKITINPQKLDSAKMAETFGSNTFRVVLINEAGLYACIFGSTKSEAKVFKKWVFQEVLPSVRKTGGYRLPSVEADLSIEEAKSAIALVMDYAKFASDEEKTQMVCSVLSEFDPRYEKILRPVVAQARLATANDNVPVTPTELGKKVGKSAREINKLLVERGFQAKNENPSSRRKPSYLLTDEGHQYGKYVTSTGKNNDRTLYQQLLWFDTVLTKLG